MPIRQKMSSASKSKPPDRSKRLLSPKVPKRGKSARVSLDEITQKINFIEDMYLKLSIADCVGEIEKAAKIRQKKAITSEGGHKCLLDLFNQETMSEALMWLRQGQNICFYGLGNKEPLVNEFVHKNFAKDHLIITIRGYQRNLTPRALLMQIIQMFESDEIDLFSVSKRTNFFSSADVVQKCIQNVRTSKRFNIDNTVYQLASLLTVVKTPIIFLIHNMDNANLRIDQFLQHFSSLAVIKPNLLDKCAPRINFVTTVDSTHSYYYLNSKIVENFSFMFYKLNCNQIFNKQLEYLSGVDIVQTGRKHMQSIKGVIESLTDSQRELVFFALFVFSKLDKKIIDENELFKKAIEEAKVSSLYQFKDNIREAVQHHIFKTKYLHNQFCYTTKLTNNEIWDILHNYNVREFDEPSLMD